MSRFKPWQSGTALLTMLTLTTSTVAPLTLQVAAAQAQTQSNFSDVSSSYWAQPFIQRLASQGVISGFPDGTFRPDDPVTRAQFASLVRQAFRRAPVRGPISFVDVPSNYWANAAIRDAYTTGFLSGYPGNEFYPDQNIPRAQVLVSLASGLQYNPSGSTDSALQVYRDASSLPDWARSSVAAATQKQIVVNYPDPTYLQPDRPATRAEVAAFIYQALVSAGNAAAIPSSYIIGQTHSSPASPAPSSAMQIDAGTTIPIRYTSARKIYLSPNEPKPVPVTLLVSRDVEASNGQVLIPQGSKINGELRVIDQRGARFYAKQLILPNNSEAPLNATSDLVTNTQIVERGANVVQVLTGAVLGSGAAAGIAAVTGDRHIDALKVLGGTAVGTLAALALGRNQVTLIAIDPNADLNLTVNSPVTIP